MTPSDTVTCLVLFILNQKSMTDHEKDNFSGTKKQMKNRTLPINNEIKVIENNNYTAHRVEIKTEIKSPLTEISKERTWFEEDLNLNIQYFSEIEELRDLPKKYSVLRNKYKRESIKAVISLIQTEGFNEMSKQEKSQMISRAIYKIKIKHEKKLETQIGKRSFFKLTAYLKQNLNLKGNEGVLTL